MTTASVWVRQASARPAHPGAAIQCCEAACADSGSSQLHYNSLSSVYLASCPQCTTRLISGSCSLWSGLQQCAAGQVSVMRTAQCMAYARLARYMHGPGNRQLVANAEDLGQSSICG